VAAESLSAGTPFIVAQLGARMHYAVPRTFHRAGRLERLYTDVCASRGWARLASGLPAAITPAALRKLAGRRPVGVPDQRITTFDSLGIAYALRLRAARSRADEARAHVWANERFCRNILDAGLADGAGVFTFNGAGLELLRAARADGRRAVMEQTIAPLSLEMRLLAEERDAHPGWERARGEGAVESLRRREEAEWREADTILCGSDFVREGIAAAGGPVERCKVVPYGVDSSAYAEVRRPVRDGQPLRVLMAGALGLRKGAPYLLAAAKLMGKGAQFRAVGPVGIESRALEDFAGYVQVLGPVPRAEMAGHYAWADVFVLPSLCEGSATVTYEALAAGLPVVCTPNTGSVVRDGIDGFIVPARDAATIAERLRLLHRDRELLARMSARARESGSTNSEHAYGTRLLGAIDGIRSP
jgi:glycosyltransferase involved in cell wall biosynthesis